MSQLSELSGRRVAIRYPTNGNRANASKSPISVGSRSMVESHRPTAADTIVNR
jgi:hypothetical protein